MNVQSLKEYLLNNDLVENLLEEIGCHSIKRHSSDYISCANYNGDNKNAVITYLNDNITVVNYTRSIAKNKRTTDILDLVCYNKGFTFPEALRFVCNLFELDFYKDPLDLPESLHIIQLLKDMRINEEDEEDTPLKPISEKILTYYIPIGNKLFEDDGISLETQRLFEVSFDPCTNSICIPIRDAFGSLVAVKARRLEHNEELGESKYFYVEPGSKSKVLYGLFNNIKMIQSCGVVYVGESEKFTQQLYEMGYYGVSTGGSKISKTQVDMLTRLNVNICFCYDKDIGEEELNSISNMFLDGVPVYAMIDKSNILNDKESPSDSKEKWDYLINNNIYKIK